MAPESNTPFDVHCPNPGTARRVPAFAASALTFAVQGG